MDRERLDRELWISGDVEADGKPKYPAVLRMMEDVLAHGEVHAIFDENEGYVEVRQGTATFDFDGEVVVIDDGITEHAFAMDHLSNWEKPMNVFEDEG